MAKMINIDKDWKFREEDLSPRDPAEGWGGAKARAYSQGAAAVDFDDSAWRTVTLPHDFVSEKAYCFNAPQSSEMRDIPEMESIGSRLFAGGCLEGGVAWYRKKFTLGDLPDGKRVYIYFDGVYRSSTLYLNQYYVGSRAGGYGGFYYDVTDFINMSGENVLSMRVDASEREGWWYEGGGIYRHVRLEIADSVHIAPWGVSVEIKDREGRVLSQTDSHVTADAWGEGEYSVEIVQKDVVLWEPDDPYLYSAVVRLCSDGEICDESCVSFGIRDIRFDAAGGFYLNGKHIRIQGLCCHHDHAGVGIGVPDSVHEYRVRKMKSMGANALRSSHYPAPPELLDICDRLGMLVFDETRRMSSAPEDIEILKSMVKRDRNHPSIFLWGIGNEEIFSQHRAETARATLTMKAEIHKLDPTRPVASAVTCWDGERRYDDAEPYISVTKHLDVMGFNYSESAWDDYHKRMPNQPIIISEDSSNSGTRGCCSTDESKGWYYILDENNKNKVASREKAVKKDLGENVWKYFAERPYLAGIFLWTGFDYRGEPTPLGRPAVYSQFGIFDYCGFPKDNYYYYKSWWSGEDVLHVFPHWNYPVGEGEKLNVYCYTNLDEAELFVNGKSYGKKRAEKNWYITWENVIYEPGELKAVGFKNGEKAEEDVVKTTLPPFAVRLGAYKDEIEVGETAIITVDIVDKNGDVVPTADNTVRFEITGAGEFVGTGNGDPGDHDSEKIPVRRAFNGKCMLLAAASREGEIKITAQSDTLAGARCVIRSVKTLI